MLNLKLIERHPRWRVWVVANLAKLMGVQIHVEGIPFGSSRTREPQARSGVAGSAGQTTPSEATQAYGYLARLFKEVAPQCSPLPTLMGLCTQIDNYIAGIRNKG